MSLSLHLGLRVICASVTFHRDSSIRSSAKLEARVIKLHLCNDHHQQHIRRSIAKSLQYNLAPKLTSATPPC